MTTERWCLIAGYPSYEVSDRGRVRRVVAARNSNAGRILRPGWRGRYLAVDLCRDGKRRSHDVHRLVAGAFRDSDPTRPEVNHKNGDRTQCGAENLEWATRQENAQHAHDLNLQDCRGEHNGQAKLSTEQVTAIRSAATGRRGERSAFARRFGVSDRTIADLLDRRTWSHV